MSLIPNLVVCLLNFVDEHVCVCVVHETRGWVSAEASTGFLGVVVTGTFELLCD